jgi:chromosome segregation ATPase
MRNEKINSLFEELRKQIEIIEHEPDEKTIEIGQLRSEIEYLEENNRDLEDKIDELKREAEDNETEKISLDDDSENVDIQDFTPYEKKRYFIDLIGSGKPYSMTKKELIKEIKRFLK